MTTASHSLRDLNHNGVLDPYEDDRLTPEERTEDLLARLSLEEKVGLMFHTVIETGPEGTLLETPGAISKSPTSTVILDKRMNHFNVHGLPTAEQAAAWANRIQRLAEQTPHGIPVTISTDPRHNSAENAGTFWSTKFFSPWPDPLGLAALDDEQLVRRFAEVVRREYTAVGIRAALHPTADLATEPRWYRQQETFGQDPERVSRMIVAYLEGLRGPDGEPSVSPCTKHFPGGGPQADGEDAHFPYGKDQVYPGGRFEDHLEPFRRAIEVGTDAIMPYYGRPVGLVRDGEAIEEVGFGFNRQMITGLLREELGFDGVILSDWELVNDNHVGDQVLPARAWGVEDLTPRERMLRILDAGCDQFGGEECVDLLLDLVREGAVPESRIDESARRLLLVKFRLGLFDDPYVDEAAAPHRVSVPEDVQLGIDTQARSVIVLHDDGDLLNGLAEAAPERRIYIEGVDPEHVAALGTVVEDPEQADLALIRLEAPFEPRDDLFLEAAFRQGSLEFPPGLPVRLSRIAAQCPLVVDVKLDRAAVLTPLVPIAGLLTCTFGVSDRAWARALSGEVPPAGRLPIQLPADMASVRASREDVPGDAAALYDAGHGLTAPRSES